MFRWKEREKSSIPQKSCIGIRHKVRELRENTLKKPFCSRLILNLFLVERTKYFLIVL